MSAAVCDQGPDVLALSPEEARRELEAAGLTVEVVETRPPRGEAAGTRRVVQQRREGDRIILVVTHERYVRSGAPSATRR